MKTKKWTFPKVLALLITVGILVLLMGIALYNMVENGYDQGKYTEDRLPTDLFDFFDALAGRRSDYKIEMMHLQSSSFFTALLVCIPCAVILLIASKKKDHVGLILGGNTVTAILMMTFLLTLHFYTFSRSPRIAVWVLFFLSAVLFAVLMAFTSRHLGLYAVAVLACSLALGFLAAVYLSQILGLVAVILRELFWVALFLLAASGTSSIPTFYVTII